MSEVFTGTIWNSLKLTLDKIVDDKTDGYEGKADYKRWMEVKTMKDHWEESLEMGGPGLASEKPEGTEIPTGTIKEGYRKRYIARTFGLRLIISEEAMEDKKYEEAINFARRLKRAMFKTGEIDCTNILVRGFDTNFPGGDGLPLWSASHTLPHGGTWSNLAATAMSPSRAAVIIHTSQIRKFPGHDGVTEGYEPKKVLCPTEQWATWAGLIESTHAPEPGAFNEINVVNKNLRLEVVDLKFWNNTTTNYGYVTDCDDGFNIRFKRRPQNRTWVENSKTLAQYAITARWDNGWTDARCSLGVNA
jgi:hypothetical protein